jgi:hypothetical protein
MKAILTEMLKRTTLGLKRMGNKKLKIVGIKGTAQ